MKNSPATFQRLVNSLIFNLVGCKAYIGDAIIFSEEWERHLQTIRNFFDRLSEVIRLQRSGIDTIKYHT